MNSAKSKRPRTDEESLYDHFINRIFTVRLLAALCLLLLLVAAIGPALTLYLMHEPERAVIVSEDGTVTIARLQRFRNALALPKIAAGQAARAMLDRGPAGIEDTDAIELMFSRAARDKVAELIKSQSATFHEYGYHQKAELADTDVVADTDGSYRAKVTGQLIRTGLFDGQPKLDRLKFTLILSFFRNESAVVNRQYPIGVWSFDYSESR